MHGNMVLPPLGPLFTTHTQNHSHSHRQLVAVAGTETLHAALCTPTSAHVHAYLHGGAFPSSSPVKKDMSSNAAASTKTTRGDHHHHHHKKGMSSSVLNLDSPKAVDAAKDHHNDDEEEEEFGSASPTCEDEKLRLSRERNRLHAQRTRIRKRELLESLKERIHALQTEHLLLKQAYEFHATAVCLLSLGGGPECDHPSVKHLEDVSEAALELFDSTSTLNACLDDEDDLDDLHASANGHEKGCEWYNDDESDHQDPDSTTGSSSSCSCQQDAGQLNSNGKRSHPSSSQMGGSKEEREQLRRERNRLHARRARLRKKLILERSQQVCACDGALRGRLLICGFYTDSCFFYFVNL